MKARRMLKWMTVLKNTRLRSIRTLLVLECGYPRLGSSRAIIWGLELSTCMLRPLHIVRSVFRNNASVSQLRIIKKFSRAWICWKYPKLFQIKIFHSESGTLLEMPWKSYSKTQKHKRNLELINLLSEASSSRTLSEKLTRD